MNRLWFLCLLGFWSFSPRPAPAQSTPNSAAVPFQFRTPQNVAYTVATSRPAPAALAAPAQWLRALPADGHGGPVELGSRVVLQARAPEDVARLLHGRPLTLARTLTPHLVILQAPDAWTAAREAAALAQLPEVVASHPVRRRALQRHGRYAPRPNDPYFPRQWHLENRDANGAPAGVDLNVRAAWPFSRGEGVTIGFCDDGVELSHPDLASQAIGAPQFNFTDGTTNGTPSSSFSDHATAVAGLALARGNNRRGVIGVAPKARLASLVIFDQFDGIATEEQLMDMFQFQSNIVSVQNHSWGNGDIVQIGPSTVEQIGISNAITLGRDGKGVVMLRSAGNNRGQGGDVSDDGYPSDPRAIAVAAVRFDGRATSYSSPGAALLIATPSGDADDDFPTIFTTDRQGALGYNQNTYTNDLADYAFDASGFSGTSASAPQASGLAALLLSANPNLGYRDVQQIFLLSARHVDRADPGIVTNGAGLLVSHNVGFGVPDAGQAVRLARQWSNRPPLTNVTLTATNVLAIPDDGLRLLITGAGVPTNLLSIHNQPSVGVHADTPTAVVPLVDVGFATNPIPLDLHGKAALIRRGTNFFRDKVQFAANAGAAFAVIYNNVDGDAVFIPGGTDFSPIPAVLISQNSGEPLAALLATNANVTAQLRLDAVAYPFVITNSLLCEHVGVRFSSDHSRRGDLRLTLVSPAGTRSVLQHLNADTSPGPADWTYYSTHHFYENSAGTWTVFVSDEDIGATGSVQSVSLSINGVPINDADHDGLDDAWELAHFGSLAQGPQDDPDGDGYSNLREQLMGTDPLTADVPFQLDLSALSPGLARLSWPSQTNYTYDVWAATNATAPFVLITNVAGSFPETEWIMPSSDSLLRFFRVERRP